MAYVNDTWLTRTEREERIAQLRKNITLYRELMKRGALTESDMIAFESDLDELEKLERVHRAEYDLLYFVYEYFSEERNPGNQDNLIPAGVKYEDAADFHRTLCSLLDDITKGNTKNNVAWSVGRGHAKTAYLSNGYLCHQTVFRHKRYIVEVSETTDVAGDFIQWTANQLKHNEKLIEDFGVLLRKRKAQNETDNKYEFITASGTKVEAKGVGTQMRGLRHGSTRPDLFLLDDLESKKNTNTPELREGNKRWFREEMLPALARGGICVYMGTIVHYDSLLNYVINERRDFVSRKFPAILEWAKHDDLWEQWREIYRSDSEDAREKAYEFYLAHEAEMLEGAKTLWPQMFPYLELMEIRENEGAKAFNQEYLGNPIDEESQIFKPEEMTFFTDDEIAGKKLEYFCGIDFAMGKEKGDYSAIITVGRSPNGIFYVVDAYIERVHPDVLLEKVVEKTMKYGYAGMAVEAQQAQEWFADKLADALAAKGYPSRTRLKQIKQRTRKELRIESLLPDIQAGRIRFNKKHRLLLEMFQFYPNHNNDDGPDAVHMAVSAAKERKVKVTNKPSWL